MAKATHTPSRRQMLASIGCIAIAAVPVPHSRAATLTTGNDAALEADWQEVVACRRQLDAVDWEGPLFPALERQLDAAEIRIRERPAATVHGATVKLWLALLHLDTLSVEQDRAVIERDMAAVNRYDEDWDWNARLVISALRALHTPQEG